jgi:Alpha-L-rhamnosidase N-terminal domain./Bacterial alpha-L-rhamnosidase.
MSSGSHGRKVGDHVLDPGWTTYDKRALYATYDITPRLREGKNVLAVSLGQGWFGSRVLKCRAEIELADGTRTIMVSDGSWQTFDGPVVEDSVYHGETYDARMETPGWDRPGFDASGWRPAQIVKGPSGVLSAQMMPAIKVVDTIVPLKMTNPRPGVYVYDMGQNFSGWVRLKVGGPRGADVRLRFAEIVNSDGMLNRDNLRSARAEDHYLLKGGGEETWEPRFTYHGFASSSCRASPERRSSTPSGAGWSTRRSTRPGASLPPRTC